MHIALTTEHIPLRLEPIEICHTDGKYPDGITVVPWKSGKILVWDTACPDTFAPSCLVSAMCGAEMVAAAAMGHNRLEYSSLTKKYSFVPVTIA